jgi:hypothetical protein
VRAKQKKTIVHEIGRHIAFSVRPYTKCLATDKLGARETFVPPFIFGSSSELQKAKKKSHGKLTPCEWGALLVVSIPLLIGTTSITQSV